MPKKFYVLCGANGLLIKANIPFIRAQWMLNRYFKGFRYIRGADTLYEARAVAIDLAARHTPPVQIPGDIQPNQMILFRDYPRTVDPMIF